MVAAVHVDEAGVLELEGDQNHDDLDGPRAAVDEVAVEEEGRLGRRPAGLRSMARRRVLAW